MRDLEFHGLFKRHPIPTRSRVFDIPAGGGYLARVLPSKMEVVGLELTDGFGGTLPV